MPDYRPDNQLRIKIESKCHVLYYIFKSPALDSEPCMSVTDEKLTDNPTSAKSRKLTEKRAENKESESSEGRLGPLHIVWPHRW